MTRLESEMNALSAQLESRKLIERANGLPQRDHQEMALSTPWWHYPPHTIVK